MSDVPPLRQNLQIEACQFRAAVSESFAQAMGGAENFINYFQYSEKNFVANGQYNLMTAPQTFVDMVTVFPFDAQVVDVWFYNLTAGASGSTQVDILVATPGTATGSWTSIFTTKPSIAYNAGDNTWVGVQNNALVGPLYSHSYTPPANTVQPVLNTSVSSLITSGQGMRFDILTQQTGTPQNCGVVVCYRPR